MQRRWFIVLLIGLFVTGIGLGALAEDDTDEELATTRQELAEARSELDEARRLAPADTTTTIAPTTTTATAPTTTIAATTTAAPTTTAPPGFGDGTHVVGDDIAPGVYRAPGGDGCYWERLSGLSGDFDDIIANDFVTSGQVVVEISESDVAFSAQGCGQWTPG